LFQQCLQENIQVLHMHAFTTPAVDRNFHDTMLANNQNSFMWK
jgi:hypothetical protein